MNFPRNVSHPGLAPHTFLVYNTKKRFKEAPMAQEFEVKYACTQQAMERLEGDFGPFQSVTMETAYYDNPNGDFGAKKWTLRRRLENGVGVCTLKTPGAGLLRGEWEVTCPEITQAIPALLAQGAPRELEAMVAQGLTLSCGAKFLRQVRLIPWGESKLELALDEGVLMGGGETEPLCEVEAELKEGRQEDALAFGAHLAATYGLTPETRSKQARALALRAQSTGAQFIRAERVYGKEAIARLSRCRVAVFGIGGVGGYVVEALARTGVGALDLIDNDKVCLSNLNRQIIATHKTLGQYKVDAARARVLDINPRCKVTTYPTFFMPENSDRFDFTKYDYVVDAIDTVTGKKEIILKARAAGVPVISCMGAGNKVDASAFRVADIYETSVCPLARIMRKLCRQNGIDHLKVVYSQEEPLPPEPTPTRRATPGSTAFAVAAAGMVAAGEVVRELTGGRVDS